MGDYTITIEAPMPVLPRKPTLEQIQAFEALVREMPQGEYPVTDHFAPGVYGREVLIPAGNVVVGKMHRDGHLNILLEGEIEVWTEEGMKRLVGPQVIISQAGIKRIGFAVTDTRWMTVHPNPTNTKDTKIIEAAIILPENPTIEHEEIPCLGSP